MSTAVDAWIYGLFRGIRIEVDWLALCASGPRVSTEKLTGRSIRNLLVPWYWAGKQTRVPVCHDAAKALTFGPCAERLPEHGDEVISVGDALEAGFKHPWFDQAKANRFEQSPYQTLKLPAYQVGRKRLLLDGNHRTIGSMKGNPALQVELVLIKGPVDRRIMRDLAVFT